VKRFLVLLLFVAGAVTWAVLAVPTNAAVVNGQVITQDQLNGDLTAYANSPDYQCYENSFSLVQAGIAQPVTVDGSGQTDPTKHPTATAQFVKGYLDSQIQQILITQLAAQRHVTVDAADLSLSRANFSKQVTTVMQDLGQTAEASLQQYSCGGTAQAPLKGATVVAHTDARIINQVVKTSAIFSNLEEVASGIGDTPADLESYFNAHQSEFDDTCFTVAQYTSQSAAEAARGTVYEGASFSTVATASGGGPAGCEALTQIASAAPNAHLTTLPLNTVSAPVQIGSAYYLLEFTKRTPVSFSEAQSVVQQTAQTLGHTRVQALLTAAEQHASVTLDPRYGVWGGAKSGVTSPVAPPATDVLNAAANAPTVTGSASPFAGSGQSG
jgi:hypothetical protein